MKISGLSLILWCLLTGAAQAEVAMVASIEPLALIGKAILGERGQVIGLVDARQSPHEYSMRPSDRMAIQQANLLVWVDQRFEIYLSDIFLAQSQTKDLITFSSLEDVVLNYEHSGELDPHIWLNTRNAGMLANAIAMAAIRLDPVNQSYYQQNLAHFLTDLQNTEREITELLSISSKKPYAVYHNAYRYFEQQFGLQHAIALLRNPESQPGVQEIMQVRGTVQDLQPECLLIEVDSNESIIATMLGGVELEMHLADIAGHDVDSDANGYQTMLRNLAGLFNGCID